MPFSLSSGVIWGIAAGAFVLVAITGSIAIVLVRRVRQQRFLARMFAAGERRLSGYPGGHLSITDEDVARMPGTRRTPRHTAQVPRTSSRGWNAVSSRESLLRLSKKEDASKKISNGGGRNATTNATPSWPLPRRLTRSSATQLVKVKPSPSFSNVKKTTEQPTQPLALSDDMKLEQDKKAGPAGMTNNLFKDQDQIIPSNPTLSIPLKPKPLFYNKPRSISAGEIDQHSKLQEQRIIPSMGMAFSVHPHTEIPRLPRSTSLCNQQPGVAPSKPVPPLPSNFPAPKQFRGIKSSAETASVRASNNSYLSGNTSELDDIWLRSPSCAETDFTSISTFSRPISDENAMYSGQLGYEINMREETKAADNPNRFSSVESANFRLQSECQKSLRGSVVFSLPRSASSGLSMSLLDNGPSRHLSITTLRDERPSPSGRSNLSIPGSADRRIIKQREASSSSPLKNSSVFDSDGTLKTRRESWSTLQVISGNEASPRQSRPPPSPALDDGLETDPVTPTKPLTLRGGKAAEHIFQTDLKIVKHRDSNTRISDKALSTVRSNASSTGDNIIENGLKDEPLKPSLLKPDKNRNLIRPPSRDTFEPQLSSVAHNRSSNNIRGTTYSPTLSMVNFYDDHAFITVSNKDQSSGSNPNRHKTIFPNHGTTRWSVLIPESGPTTTVRSVLDSENHSSTQSQSLSFSPSKRPSSFLIPIPPDDLPKRRSSPVSPVRGPRAPPARRSPTRRIGKAGYSSNGRDLRKSVEALRRKNSEAKDWPLEQRKCYLSVGRTGSPVYEDEPVSSDIFEPTSTVGGRCQEQVLSQAKGPREMPSSNYGGLRTPEKMGSPKACETPRSLFDSEGFLKE